jgi:hypothetical protein
MEKSLGSMIVVLTVLLGISSAYNVKFSHDTTEALSAAERALTVAERSVAQAKINADERDRAIALAEKCIAGANALMRDVRQSLDNP